MDFNQLADLDPGSLIEAGALLPSITKEKVAHIVKGKTTNAKGVVESVSLESYFCDILVVRIEGVRGQGGGIKWSIVK
jgi:hypothetical protein